MIQVNKSSYYILIDSIVSIIDEDWWAKCVFLESSRDANALIKLKSTLREINYWIHTCWKQQVVHELNRDGELVTDQTICFPINIGDRVSLNFLTGRLLPQHERWCAPRQPWWPPCFSLLGFQHHGMQSPDTAAQGNLYGDDQMRCKSEKPTWSASASSCSTTRRACTWWTCPASRFYVCVGSMTV